MSRFKNKNILVHIFTHFSVFKNAYLKDFIVYC